MTENSTKLQLLVSGLEAVLPEAADFNVAADLSYSWLGQRIARIRRGEAVVALELDEKELKIHVAGESSPARKGETSMTVAEFVDKLRELPLSEEPTAINYSTSIVQGDYTLTLNVPTRSVTVTFQPKARAMMLAFRACSPRATA